MGISRIFFQQPEIVFAEWMASRQLNDSLETECMLTMESSFNFKISQEAAAKVDSSSIDKAKTGSENLKDRVADLASHEHAQWNAEDKKLLWDALEFFNLNSERLGLIKHDSIQTLFKDLEAIARILRRELCYRKYTKESAPKQPKFTILDIKKALNESMDQIEHLIGLFRKLLPLEPAYIPEDEKPTFTSKVEHVAKRVEKRCTIYKDHLGVSNFEFSSEPTHYYLINKWLVVSAVPSGPQNPASSPVEFKTGDEPMLLQLIDEGEQLPPDQILRLRIIQSIDAWNKLQIKKMRNIMLTSLVGAGICGSSFLIPFKPQAPIAAKVVYFFMFFFFFLLGSVSVRAGIHIHSLYLLRERVSEIKDLGDWVKQLRTYVRKYPVLAHRYIAVQKILSPKEMEWVRSKLTPAVKA